MLWDFFESISLDYLKGCTGFRSAANLRGPRSSLPLYVCELLMVSLVAYVLSGGDSTLNVQINIHLQYEAFLHYANFGEHPILLQ